MHSSSVSTVSTAPITPEAGEVVATHIPGVDRVVHETAMRANFMVRAIHDFCQADWARRESGTPDDLGYLSRAMSMVMEVALYEQRFAEICRDHKGNREEIGRHLKEALKGFQGFDASELIAQIQDAEVSGQQLDVAAGMHDATVDEVNIVLEDLQERVDALLQPATLGYAAGRRH